MKVGQTLIALKLIKMYILDREDKFTTGNHFVDKNGKSLPPDASSIPRVAQRCIGGAVIEALDVLGFEGDASSTSHGYKVVMYNLGDSLGNFKGGAEKIAAVMHVNNHKGFLGTHAMIDKAIEQCKGMLATKSRR